MGSPDLTEADSDISAFVDTQDAIFNLLDNYEPSANDDSIKILAAMWKYLPTDGRANFAEDVLECSSDEEIKQLADSIVSGLLNPMQAMIERAVLPSPSQLESMLDEPVTRSIQGVLRDQCLCRDGNMCAVSHFYNMALLDQSRPAHHTRPHSYLQAAHILPSPHGMFSTNDERWQTARVWDNIYRYFPTLRTHLNFDNTSLNSSVDNMMMLTEQLHRDFGRFNFALEASNVPNQYRVKKFPRLDATSNLVMSSSGFVTFTCHDRRYPPPSPVLLSVHAAIANILNATGRAEAVEKILQDYNTTKMLARDGSTDVSRLLSVSALSLLSDEKKNAPQKQEDLRPGRDENTVLLLDGVYQ